MWGAGWSQEGGVPAAGPGPRYPEAVSGFFLSHQAHAAWPGEEGQAWRRGQGAGPEEQGSGGVRPQPPGGPARVFPAPPEPLSPSVFFCKLWRVR